MRTVLAAIMMLCVTTAALADNVKAEIDRANKAFVAAYAKGDAAALAAMYTDDATVLPAGAPMVKGRDAIQKLWKGVIDSGLKITTIEAVAVEAHGSVAREIGRATGEAPDAQKKMVPTEIKYVVFWKRVKGSWKLNTDIWNTNQ